MLTISAVAPGYPTPRLYWFKDGQPLTASEHIRMADRKTLHTLEIVSVTSKDAGQYSAYISNTVGAAYSSAWLLVRGGCWGTQQSLASIPGLIVHLQAMLCQAFELGPGGHYLCAEVTGGQS